MLIEINVPGTSIVDIRIMNKTTLRKVVLHKYYAEYEALDKDVKVLRAMQDILSEVDRGILSSSGICGMIWLSRKGKKLELVSGYLTYLAVTQPSEDKKTNQKTKSNKNDRTALCIITEKESDKVINKRVKYDLYLSAIIKGLQNCLTLETIHGENGKSLTLRKIYCDALRAFAGKNDEYYELISAKMISSKRKIALILGVSEATIRRWYKLLGWKQYFKKSDDVMQNWQEFLRLHDDEKDDE